MPILDSNIAHTPESELTGQDPQENSQRPLLNYQHYLNRCRPYESLMKLCSRDLLCGGYSQS